MEDSTKITSLGSIAMSDDEKWKFDGKTLFQKNDEDNTWLERGEMSDKDSTTYAIDMGTNCNTRFVINYLNEKYTISYFSPTKGRYTVTLKTISSPKGGKPSPKKSKWVSTGKKTTLKNGSTPTLFSNASYPPSDLRIKRMVKGRDGIVHAKYVKPA